MAKLRPGPKYGWFAGSSPRTVAIPPCIQDPIPRPVSATIIVYEAPSLMSASVVWRS